MNPDNSSEAMFKVMHDVEWVELPKMLETINTKLNAELNKITEEALNSKPIFSDCKLSVRINPPKLNQHFFDSIRLVAGFPTNNWLKFHGIKMRRRNG